MKHQSDKISTLLLAIATAIIIIGCFGDVRFEYVYAFPFPFHISNIEHFFFYYGKWINDVNSAGLNYMEYIIEVISNTILEVIYVLLLLQSLALMISLLVLKNKRDKK